MRTLVLTALAVVCGLAAAPAQAMPFGPLSDARPGVTLVAQGCGPGWFRGPYGRCVPMGGPAPYYHPAPYYRPVPYARPYPYGPHYGPHCWWRGGVRVCR